MTTPCNSYSEPEWRHKTLKERLAFAYTNKLFTDVTISVKLGGKENTFKAHKNVLANFSSVLEELFYGNEDRDLSNFELTDIDPRGLDYVLKQLYHVPPSPRKDIDRSILISAYHAAVKLRMRQLATEMREEILDRILTHSLITRDDFWKILELSRILKLEDITNRLLTFAESNGKEVLRAKSLVMASPNTLKRVLDFDNLKTSEGEVLDSISRWKEGNTELPFLDDFVKDLLGCVRFRNLSLMDLCQFVASKNDLISRDDILDIMMHLGNPASKPLPRWCSTKFRCSVTCNPTDSLTVPQTETSSKILNNTKELSFGITQRGHACLLNMYFQQKHADVCFLVGSGQKRMKAHRNVLALGSFVFEKMFFSCLADSRYEIEVPNQDPDGFEKLLMYFYDDTNPDSLFRKSDVAIKTFEAALKYGSTNLKEICAKYYSDIGKQKNFWKQLESKKKHSPKDAKSLKKLLEYAEKYTKEVLDSPDFLNASQDAVKHVLELNTLSIKEIDVLSNTVRWLQQNSKTSKSEKGKYELLCLVRFDDISAGDFCSIMKQHAGILPKDQTLSILLHLHNKSSPLPEWCYKGPTRTLSNVSSSLFSNNHEMSFTVPSEMKFSILSKQQK